VLLICCFLSGIIIQICQDEDESCERIILPSLDNYYQASVLALILTATMLGITIIFMIVIIKNEMNAPTIRLNSTRNKPNLEMAGNCKSHAFVSHVWATGQDKAQKIVRMIQLVLPGIKIWLDVDNLSEFGQLENSVRGSSFFLLFYSKGYFKSINCVREVTTAVRARVPTLVVYEGDDAIIETMKKECKDYFAQIGQNAENGILILSHILKEKPILWLGSSMQCYASESLKLIISRLLYHLPYYQRNPAQLTHGLTLGNELGTVRVLSQLRILYCDENEGAKLVAEEAMEEASGNVSVSNIETVLHSSETFESEDVVLLLYLNENTFLDTGAKVKELVKESLEQGINVVLVHEKDISKGGCEFDLLLSQTPQELQNPPYKLYKKDLAVPLYTLDAYRTVSLRLLLGKMKGKSPRKPLFSHRFEQQFNFIRDSFYLVNFQE